MRNKILKAILTVAGTALLACIVMVLGVLYPYFGNLQQNQLKDELRLAAQGVNKLGVTYLEELQEQHDRLTLIAPSGKVLYDSQVKAEKMENHGDREEVQEALKNGTGTSSRYSNTLTEQYLYEAVRLEDGSVLRISESRATAVTLVLGMLQPIFFLLCLVLFLSLWLANRMAKKVVEPLNTLDLDAPMDNDAYEELTPLLRRLYAQQLEIQGQVRTLERKQDEFNQITENVREALVLLDTKDRIVSMNPAARHLFCVGNLKGEDFLLVEHKTSMLQAMEEAKENGFASWREEREGRQYQFEITRIESGNRICGLVLFGYDVTEQMQAEKARREFTANVSHELKTPLQSIIGSAELMENGIVKPEDETRFIGHIRREASRLLTLIDDIIRLSQLDEGGEQPTEAVSLRQLALEVEETLQDAAKEKQIAFTVTGQEGMMQGVSRLLYEILYNLCDNGIKYNQVGGSLQVDIQEQNDGIFLAVSDTGIGIAPAEQDKVFERFYRVDKSHSKQSGGTGLGLSIVKHAVACHGGTIHMESVPGEGTKVTVRFPQ